MPFQIIRNDITKVSADAIVNTANPKPRIGGGTDSAIFAAAGEEQLLAERKRIGDIVPGNAVRTGAYALNAKHIIHTVGPVWTDGRHGEREILHACYANSLTLAAELNCESIAFPLIASGSYGFPKDEALNIALAEIGKFLLTHEMEVILVVFDRKALQLSEQLVSGIEQYIDDHAADRIREEEYGKNSGEAIRRLYNCKESQSTMFTGSPFFQSAKDIYAPASCESSLDEMLDGTTETFQKKLFELIDESGMDDVTVYKKANVDRKVFSQIRCKKDYRPSKKTAVGFAIALQLDYPTTLDLLSRAELAFSPCNRFDLIVSYFIKKRIYDIYEINAVLFKYGEPGLGV